jgi:hypothetical protein
MTKKDYIKIAAMFADGRPEPCECVPTCRCQPQVFWQTYIHTMCDILAEDNPRFDRMRFQKACGLTR